MTRFRLVSCAALLAFLAPVVAPAQSAPIRIGFLAPLTGPFAQIGKDMVNGNQLYLAEIGGQVAGHKIEVLVEDDEGNPATALNKSRKLVEQDKIQILTGGMLANVGYALQPYIDAQKIPTTYPVIAADDITQRKPAKWIVRTGWSTSQPMHPFADWVLKNTKYRKIAAIVFLKNFVSVYTKRWLLILGAVYIGVILFAPRGVLGALRSQR